MRDECAYKLAIEERARHQQNFNHWMNMYAIFNGALFMGYYTILEKVNDFNAANAGVCLFSIIVLCLGCITGWFWHFSCRGYYRWILSWIKIVAYYESKLKDVNGNDVFIYRLFGTDKRNANPFSTQKLTLWLSGAVAVAWSIMLIFEIVRKCIGCIVPDFQKNWCIVKSVFLILVVLVVVVAMIKFCREDLRNSHKKLTGNLKEKYGVNDF